MTRKEKELKVLKAFDLKLNDKIKILQVIYKIVEEKENYILRPIDNNGNDLDLFDISDLIDTLISLNWEKVEPSLKDKKCEDFACSNCVFKKYHCALFFQDDVAEHTLGEIYEKIKADLNKAEKELDCVE